MMLRVYSIKDELVGFGRPVVMENDDVAVRQFSDLVNSTPEYRDHAKDYSLFFIGEFDTEVGIVYNINDNGNFPIKVVDALSVVKPLENL